ncbi:TIR domain-containing protein [Natrinema salifodinae]|uniref:MTH538 TIR-like domain n=2 Tax=Halobacteriales TaxID=2235 RepID=A0A1I0N0X4_9EURY|nr:TIR domain-containing protein [Natrinema salifodinae]SEV94672.1 MTH538 TIR-like domain [Natrinema salifodinae]
MSWQLYFDRAKRSTSPVAVDKQLVGPIPPGFEARGLTIDGLWGVYERRQGLDQIQITELPAQYRVSVSNPVVSGNQLSQPTSQSNQNGNALKGLAALGLGVLGAAAIGKAIGGSQNSTAPDPKQAHRVFISHSWTYENHFTEVKEFLDDAYGFEYFDHSVSSDNPIDAQLPNHLRKKIRDQMRSTSVVLVLAGMYVAHSDWIQEEIEMANEMEKPMIGVIPAENDRVPALVQEHATELVEADGTAILNAIEQHAT